MRRAAQDNCAALQGAQLLLVDFDGVGVLGERQLRSNTRKFQTSSVAQTPPVGYAAAKPYLLQEGVALHKYLNAVHKHPGLPKPA